jgi:nitrite reductase/ring-hydroxylating ferredoxin subunit
MATQTGMFTKGANGAAVTLPPHSEKDFRAYIHDHPEREEFTVDRSIFTDPDIFNLEMRAIFEGNWIYLAHESQLPRPHDFYTTTIGRQPIILMRNKAGEIGGFLNACPHRGATVCLSKRVNQKVLTCPYHGWSFNTDGTLVGVKGYASGAYPESFDQLDHGLVRLPRLESYRGFLFGSLSPAVNDLTMHLGEARVFIDMLVDQAPQGLEVVRGSTDYTYASASMRIFSMPVASAPRTISPHLKRVNVATKDASLAGSKGMHADCVGSSLARMPRRKRSACTREPAVPIFAMSHSFMGNIATGSDSWSVDN